MIWSLKQSKVKLENERPPEPELEETGEWLLAWLEVILELPKNRRILKEIHDRERREVLEREENHLTSIW